MAGPLYPERFTWSHPVGSDVVAHSDGAVSLLIRWDGIDTVLEDEPGRAAAMGVLYSALEALPEGLVAEFHLWRDHDAAVADAYDRRTGEMVRGERLGRLIRDGLSAHLRRSAFANSVGVVLTLPGRQGILVGRALARQAEATARLRESAERLADILPGGRIAPFEEFVDRIRRTTDRAGFLRDARPGYDPRFSLAEQLVRTRPNPVEDSGRTVQLDGIALRTLFLFLYPDAEPGWAAHIAGLDCPLHISQVVLPASTRAVLHAAERRSDTAAGLLASRGRDQVAHTVNELDEFRRLVVESNLKVFRNAWMVQLFDPDPARVGRTAAAIIDRVEQSGGQVRDNPALQLPLHRVAQPAQGYRCPVLRPDHTWQVAHMLPAQVEPNGDRRGNAPAGDSLRRTRLGQLVSFDFTTAPVVHYLTSAMTRAGKGVDAVATIGELYPLGVDFQIIEVGECYRWLVEGFGGTYTAIDPEHTAVNPLPPWRYARTERERPLSPELAGSTVRVLAYLLTDGKTVLSAPEEAAATAALQAVYRAPGTGTDDRTAPGLPAFLAELRNHIAEGRFRSPEQKTAATRMADNLEAFLATSAGVVFCKDDNLPLSEGITGVDLRAVERVSGKLLNFYLLAISLRMLFQAMRRRTRSFIWLDELHYFVRHAPEVVGRVAEETVRMGGKENTFLGIVTQELQELESISRGVLNNIPLGNFLYRQRDHGPVAERLQLKPGPAARWTGWPSPLRQNWRPAMRQVGDDYYELALSFPELLLDLADSSPAALDLKERIGSDFHDVEERIAALRQLRREEAA